MQVANFCRTVPDGLLVFFSSYSMMGSFVAFWQRCVLQTGGLKVVVVVVGGGGGGGVSFCAF